MMSERNIKEFQGMVSEKHAAFAQSYWEMALQVCRLNQELIIFMTRAVWAPYSLHAPWAASSGIQTQNPLMTVLEKGLAPVHRRVVLNAKRLSNPRVR
jgi:hypothetical protein